MVRLPTDQESVSKNASPYYEDPSQRGYGAESADRWENDSDSSLLSEMTILEEAECHRSLKPVSTLYLLILTMSTGG